MADESKTPKTGDVVTVINSGDHNLFDPNTGIFYPARTEVKVKMNRFVEDQMALGNMKLTSDEGAPKAAEGNKLIDATRETDVAAPVDVENDPAYVKDETLRPEGDQTEYKLPAGENAPKGRSRRGV